MRLSVKAIMMAIFCNILFGSASPMIKLGYEYFGIVSDAYSAILYAGIRFFISGVAVFIFDWIRERRVPVIDKGNRLNVVLLAITYTFLQYTFFYLGLSNTSGATGSVVNTSSVFMAIIIAHFMYRDDKMNVKKILGCLIGFCGVLVVCFADMERKSISFFGEGFVFIASMFFVTGSMINKRASRLNNCFTITACNLLIGGAMMIIFGLSGYSGEMKITWQGIVVLLYLSMVSSVGFTIWSMLLQKYPIGKISVYNFIIPVAGTVLSAVILGENVFKFKYVLALILVSLGIIIINIEKRKRNEKICNM